MDAQGARDLARRIESNARLTPRPAPAEAPAGPLPVYRWFGGAGQARATEPAAPAQRPSVRRLRFRGR